MAKGNKTLKVRDIWRGVMDALDALLGQREPEWVPVPVDRQGRRRRKRADRSGG